MKLFEVLVQLLSYKLKFEIYEILEVFDIYSGR